MKLSHEQKAFGRAVYAAVMRRKLATFPRLAAVSEVAYRDLLSILDGKLYPDEATAQRIANTLGVTLAQLNFRAATSDHFAKARDQRKRRQEKRQQERVASDEIQAATEAAVSSGVALTGQTWLH